MINPQTHQRPNQVLDSKNPLVETHPPLLSAEKILHIIKQKDHSCFLVPEGNSRFRNKILLHNKTKKTNLLGGLWFDTIVFVSNVQEGCQSKEQIFNIKVNC